MLVWKENLGCILNGHEPHYVIWVDALKVHEGYCNKCDQPVACNHNGDTNNFSVCEWRLMTDKESRHLKRF